MRAPNISFKQCCLLREAGMNQRRSDEDLYFIAPEFVVTLETAREICDAETLKSHTGLANEDYLIEINFTKYLVLIPTVDYLLNELGENFYSMKRTQHGWEALSSFFDLDKPGDNGGRHRSEGVNCLECLGNLYLMVHKKPE